MDLGVDQDEPGALGHARQQILDHQVVLGTTMTSLEAKSSGVAIGDPCVSQV